MNPPHCPLCGDADNVRCFSERGYVLSSCNTCALFFIDPYNADVHDTVSTYDYSDISILEPDKHHISSTSYYKETLLPLILQQCSSARSLLDVGCGTGSLLELLHNHSSKIRGVGVELNKDRANFARTVTGCEIYQIPVENFAYRDKFDVITLINVLSHIPSIAILFKSLRALLHDDGKVILKVGEMTRNVRQDAVFDWGIPDHLHFLGTQTVRFICEQYGFKVIHHDRWPLSQDLFSYRRWTTPGRSSVRNFAKHVVARTPFALWMLRKLYERRHHNTVFSSFIVLSPA